MTKSKLPKGRKSKEEYHNRLSILDETALSEVHSIEKLKRFVEEWQQDFQQFCPPESWLEKVVLRFTQTTCIPLAIPFYSAISCISAKLLEKEVIIKRGNEEIIPSLWTVILANSGAGKSFTMKLLKKITKVKSLEDADSAAKFIEDLAINNNSLYWVDELAEKFKGINENPMLQEFKKIFLFMYDNSEITRNTKKGGLIKIEKPAVAFLGTTVKQSFYDNIDPIMFKDGFLQRFNYAIAEEDLDRPASHYPFFDTKDYEKELSELWLNVEKTIKHKEYILGDDAFDVYRVTFMDIFKKHGLTLPQSFLRRISFSCIKLSLIYHILTENESQQISKQAMNWASRLVGRHLKDLGLIFEEFYGVSISELLVKAKAIKDELERYNSMVIAGTITQDYRGYPAQVKKWERRYLSQRIKGLSKETLSYIMEQLEVV